MSAKYLCGSGDLTSCFNFDSTKQLDITCDSNNISHPQKNSGVSFAYRHCFPCNFRFLLKNVIKSAAKANF